MYDHLKKRNKVVLSSRDDGELHDEEGNLLTDDLSPDVAESSRNLLSVLNEVCTGPHDQRLLQMKEEGKLTEAEMGKELGLSRDQVNRRLHHLQQELEDRLGLKHKPIMKRKKRKTSAQAG